MNARLISSFFSSVTNSLPIYGKPNTGIVISVVLDETHERIQNVDNDSQDYYTDKETDIVGHIIVRPHSDNTSSESQLQSYRPLNPSLLDLPLVGETVELYQIGSVKYYRRFSGHYINTGNASADKNKKIFSKTDSSQKKASYSTVAATGTSNSSTSNERETPIGEYFLPQQVNKLKYYEGDSVLQSRFGQSIRFSGYNNVDQEYSPTIILRNRQNDESINTLKVGDLVEEEINKDGSVIVMSSNRYKLDFQPGLIDDGGSSNFKTTPINFELPKEYTGHDQILINSERIILSAKSQEMIFFSKGDYGFISDGTFKIDNGEGGADLDFGANINITADRNDSRFYLFTGTGEVWLNTDDRGQSRGTKQKEPIARAATLVDLLSKLIDAITQQVYATPAGPSAQGPLNIAAFKQIQGQLDKIKSDYNFTD